MASNPTGIVDFEGDNLSIDGSGVHASSGGVYSSGEFVHLMTLADQEDRASITRRARAFGRTRTFAVPVEETLVGAISDVSVFLAGVFD